MTGYTVHTGTNKKFSEGWERVFSKSKAKAKPTSKGTTKPASGKKRGGK